MAVVIGTAGWTIPRASVEHFSTEGSHLARYAQRFSGVEINSCFYRAHRPGTYARWAESVPTSFRFSVKVPKHITHELRLVGGDHALDTFLFEVRHLEHTLGPLLVQLPPSLAYDEAIAYAFFQMLRGKHAGPIALEPRHATWFTPEAGGLLDECDVARVLADPSYGPARPAASLAYARLHGSPRTYYSSYDDPTLARVAEAITRTNAPNLWCIFDNTAQGAATPNALNLSLRLRSLSA